MATRKTKKDLAEMQIDPTAAQIAAATASDDLEEVQQPKERKDRREYDEAEAAFFRSLATTSGRKGVKMRRINMAFTDENYLFVKTGARCYGRTMTQFVNDILTRFVEEHPEVKERSQAWYNLIYDREDEEE